MSDRLSTKIGCKVTLYVGRQDIIHMRSLRQTETQKRNQSKRKKEALAY